MYSNRQSGRKQFNLFTMVLIKVTGKDHFHDFTAYCFVSEEIIL